MFTKLKEKFSKTITTELVVETKKSVKRFLPKIMIGLATILTMLVVGTKSVPQHSTQTVNNYYIYNGPVYSHE